MTLCSQVDKRDQTMGEKSLASKRVSLASNHENSRVNSIYTAKSENNHLPKRIVSRLVV